MVVFIVLITIICLGLITVLIYLSLKESEKDRITKEDKITDNCTSQNMYIAKIEQDIKDYGYTPTSILYYGNNKYIIYVSDSRIDYIEYEKTAIRDENNFTIHAIIVHNKHKLIINKLINLHEVSEMLMSSETVVNEIDNRFNIHDIKYINYSLFEEKGLFINTDNLLFRYEDNILTIDNSLIKVKKPYQPNNFEYYMKEFNQRVKFFYEDVAEYVNENKRINGYNLTFDKDSIVAAKGFDTCIILYEFKINVHKDTVDVYRDHTHLETKYIIDLNNIHTIVTSYLDKKVNSPEIDIRMY